MQATSACMEYVNNDYYEHLSDKWYTEHADPVALLRLESLLKNPWVINIIQSFYPDQRVKIVDIGCGGGFLSNALALAGHQVTGIDLSQSSLETAKRYDDSKTVMYQQADATAIPLDDKSFDVVCCMDMLEHVEDPAKVISEASRLLRPGGIFFFHTFDRNFLSWLMVIKCMEWFMPQMPKNLHILRLFIRPRALVEMMNQVGLKKLWMGGLSPNFFSRAFLWSIWNKRIHPDFKFSFVKSTSLGYIGYAKKI